MRNILITALVFIFCIACKRITSELAAQPFEKKSEPLTYSSQIKGENIYLNTDSVHWQFNSSGKASSLQISIHGESNCDSILVETTEEQKRIEKSRDNLFSSNIHISHNEHPQVTAEMSLILYLYYQDTLFDTVSIAAPTP